MLGNDVNLRDFEGRSALLLSKAKDNTGSCALGPFIRLFGRHVSRSTMSARRSELRVAGTDGFILDGSSSDEDDQPPTRGDRPPGHRQVQPIPGRLHHLPRHDVRADKDRGEKGSGFTTRSATSSPSRRRVSAASPTGSTTSDKVPPWRFGTLALMENLARRGCLERADGIRVTIRRARRDDGREDEGTGGGDSPAPRLRRSASDPNPAPGRSAWRESR